MSNIDLSIIIVSYNIRRLLTECVESIIKNTKKINYEIIVVDNASSDDTVSEINKLTNKKNMSLKIIHNKENYGFSKANNIGIQKSKGKYLLFLNPDTLVYENTLEGMIDFMEEEKSAGAATCFIALPSGELDDAAHRGFPTPWRSFCHFSGISKLFPNSKLFSGYTLGWMDKNKIHEIEACAGAFMMVRREAGEQINWWDEEFFWYGEDLDFCFRLKEKNWNIFFVPTFKIFHYKGASGGIKKISQHLSSADIKTKKRARYERFRAMKIFYEKHYKDKYPKILSKIVLIGIDLKYRISS